MKSHDTNPEFTSGSHLSFWIDSVKPIEFEKLKKNLETDVVIIGGGISGISVAYNLCMQGKKVVLVEDGFIGSGETGRTTAHLVSAQLPKRNAKCSRCTKSHKPLARH